MRAIIDIINQIWKVLAVFFREIVFAHTLTKCVIISFSVFGIAIGAYITLRPDYISYEKPRFAIITRDTGAFIRDEPNVNGDRIMTLKKRSIFNVTAETREKQIVQGVGNEKWYNIQTLSGREGWIFGGQFSFIDTETAERRIRRDRSRFEDRLKILLINESARRIRESGLFPYDNISDLQIMSPLQPVSSHSYDVYVDAFLIGAFFGVDKQRVSTKINLELEIDQNLLNSSEIRVRHVDILGFRRMEGVEPGQAVDLLINVLN